VAGKLEPKSLAIFAECRVISRAGGVGCIVQGAPKMIIAVMTNAKIKFK